MSDKKLTDTEEVTLWQQARQRLAVKKLKSAFSPKMVDRLRAQLPKKQENETIGDLIRRASKQTQASGEIIPFAPKQIRRYKPLAEFVRLAADTSESEIPLPDPKSALESPDGRFRLRVIAKTDGIEILVQALGFAADQFAK